MAHATISAKDQLKKTFARLNYIRSYSQHLEARFTQTFYAASSKQKKAANFHEPCTSILVKCFELYELLRALEFVLFQFRLDTGLPQLPYFNTKVSPFLPTVLESDSDDD